MPTRSLETETIREIVEAVARSLEAVPRALEQQLAALQIPLPPPATPAGLPAAVRSLREATSQVDLLRRLLASVADRGGRAALFVLRDGRLVGWEGAGFTDEPELSGDLSTRALPADAPATARVLEGPVTRVSCSVDGDVPVPDFGQTQRGEAWLHPLRVAERIAAVLYVDPAGTEVPDLEGISVLVEVAGLVVERLAASHAQQPGVRPTVSQPVAARAVPPGETTPPAEDERSASEDATPAEAAGPTPPAAAAEPPTSPEESPTAAEEAGPSSGEASVAENDPAGDFSGVEAALELEDAPGETDPEPAAPPAAGSGAAEATPPAPPAEPVGATPGDQEDTGSSFEIMTPEELGAQEPDASAEEDARRFARLLMQEILLYHQDEVERGRVGRDLLARLADPIANARRLYEQRVSPDQPARMAWFEEEMIRILAEGDPDLLGQAEQQEA